MTKLIEGEREKILRLQNILHERVIGQNEAVDAVSEAIMRARAGIKDPHRPIGSLIPARTHDLRIRHPLRILTNHPFHVKYLRTRIFSRRLRLILSQIAPGLSGLISAVSSAAVLPWNGIVFFLGLLELAGPS